MNHQISTFLLFLLMSAQSAGILSAQDSRTVNVTSVTCTIDPMTTEKNVETAKAVFDKFTEVRDLDLKGRKCNFTVTAGEAKAKEILSLLENAGFSVVVVEMLPGQVLTVPNVAARKAHPKSEELAKEKEVESGK